MTFPLSVRSRHERLTGDRFPASSLCLTVGRGNERMKIMDQCDHSTTSTPFCPYCGERVEKAVTLDLLEVRKYISSQLATMTKSAETVARRYDQGNVSRRTQESLERWQRRLAAIDHAISTIARASTAS